MREVGPRNWLLRDISETPSVDFFLRNLEFPFPKSDIVGIPGGISAIGFSSGTTDVPALLVHEFEHITQLTWPVGEILSALAIRANDLLRTLLDPGLPDASKLTDGPLDELAVELSKLNLNAFHLAEMARLVFVTAELLSPLLESLALVSEWELTFEGDAAPNFSWLTAATLEYLYTWHWAILNDAKIAALFLDPSERQQFVVNLIDHHQQALEQARVLHANDWSIERIFFRLDGDKNSPASLPYFCGYLYLQRLFQSWSSRLPGLSLARFHHLASRLACSVLPVSLLPFYSFENFGGEFPSRLLLVAFERLLAKALSLSAEELVRLEQDEALLRWPDLKSELTSGEFSEAPTTEDSLEAELLWNVFDAREGDGANSRHETIQLLREVREAKKFTPTAARAVKIAGIDTDAKALFLLEYDRVEATPKGETKWAAGPGAVTFITLDEKQLTEILTIANEANYSIPQLKLGSAPYRLKSVKDAPAGVLLTFCQFWPDGVPMFASDKFGMTAPMDIVRLLVLRNKNFYSPPEPDIKKAVVTRGFINRILKENLRIALADDYTESRKVWSTIANLAAKRPDARVSNRYSILHKSAAFMLSEFTAPDRSEEREQCRQVYYKTLFPEIGGTSATGLADNKLVLLLNKLMPSDQHRVRRWFYGGLVLSPARAYPTNEDSEPLDVTKQAVGRIRSVALELLGIPLLNINDEGAVILDLVPVN